VQSLKFIGVSQERSTPLQVKQYVEAFAKVKTAEEAFTKEKNAYQKENIDTIQRILKAEEGKKAVAKADLTVHDTWAKFVN
jgi:hypothetical protein